MSNWNEEIDKPNKCRVCVYDSNGNGCNCPSEFRKLQCNAMLEKYYNYIDENGKRYRNTFNGREYSGNAD